MGVSAAPRRSSSISDSAASVCPVCRVDMQGARTYGLAELLRMEKLNGTGILSPVNFRSSFFSRLVVLAKEVDEVLESERKRQYLWSWCKSVTHRTFEPLSWCVPQIH